MKHGKPVFVDGTGRRRKLMRRAGLGFGALLGGYALVLGIGLGTGADVPMDDWIAPPKTERPKIESVPTLLRRTPEPEAAGTRPPGTAPAKPAPAGTAPPEPSTAAPPPPPPPPP
ncbi:hypothetical protein, partial [Actinocorallia lasiicapitis]